MREAMNFVNDTRPAEAAMQQRIDSLTAQLSRRDTAIDDLQHSLIQAHKALNHGGTLLQEMSGLAQAFEDITRELAPAERTADRRLRRDLCRHEEFRRGRTFPRARIAAGPRQPCLPRALARALHGGASADGWRACARGELPLLQRTLPAVHAVRHPAAAECHVSELRLSRAPSPDAAVLRAQDQPVLGPPPGASLCTGGVLLQSAGQQPAHRLLERRPARARREAEIDITDIPYADGSFDVILCSHVLEHIPDDRRAMRELRRVLAPRGWALLQVPIDHQRAVTFEDPSVTDPAERARLFGQHDHVRWYGRDTAHGWCKAASMSASMNSSANSVRNGSASTA